MSLFFFMKDYNKYVCESAWPLHLDKIYINKYNWHVHSLDGISSDSLANEYNYVLCTVVLTHALFFCKWSQDDALYHTSKQSLTY